MHLVWFRCGLRASHKSGWTGPSAEVLKDGVICKGLGLLGVLMSVGALPSERTESEPNFQILSCPHFIFPDVLGWSFCAPCKNCPQMLSSVRAENWVQTRLYYSCGHIICCKHSLSHLLIGPMKSWWSIAKEEKIGGTSAELGTLGKKSGTGVRSGRVRKEMLRNKQARAEEVTNKLHGRI